MTESWFIYISEYNKKHSATKSAIYKALQLL